MERPAHESTGREIDQPCVDAGFDLNSSTPASSVEDLAADPVLAAIDALLRSIVEDDDRHGGLLSRDTIRRADELRSLVIRERRRRSEPDPTTPDGPRQPRGPL